MDNNQLETMLTARQVADFLQVSISTVRRWSNQGMMKFYRIGSRGDRRYRRKDVLRFLQESSGRSGTEAAGEKVRRHLSKNRFPAPRGKTRHSENKPIHAK